MSRIRFVCCLLVGVLLLSLADRGAANSQVDCASAHCVYLPVVNFTIPVRIVYDEGGRDRPGNYHLVANLTAATDDPVFDVVLEAKVYDQENQLLGVYTDTTSLVATLPGQLNPVLIFTPLSVFDYTIHHELSIIDWNMQHDQIIKPLMVVYSDTWLTDPIRYIYAEFRNDEPYPLTKVQALGWSMPYGCISEYETLDILYPGEIITHSFGGMYCGYPMYVAAQGEIWTDASVPVHGESSPLGLTWLDPFWTWDILEPGRSWLEDPRGF